MNKYALFYQKPYCCAIACLQMIVFRHTGIVIPQEDTAWRFGVRVAGKLSQIYSYPFGTLTSHGNDEGVSTMELVEKLDAYFSEHQFPLKATAHPATQEFIEHLEGWIERQVEAENDIWIEYSNGSKEYPAAIHIHDSLVERYDPESKTVTLLDPNPDALNYREMPIEELKERISGTYGKRTGIVLVQRT